MSRISLLTAAAGMLLAGSLYAQDLAGEWRGALQGGSRELPLVLNITRAGAGEWKATLTSVDPPSATVEVNSVAVDRASLTVVAGTVGASYEAKISADGSFM